MWGLAGPARFVFDVGHIDMPAWAVPDTKIWARYEGCWSAWTYRTGMMGATGS